MNTMEVLHPYQALRATLCSRKFAGAGLLLLAIFVSALAIVYVQSANRRLFSQLEVLQQKRDDLHVVWNQLLLEQSAWATQARVQHIAHSQLHMIVPQQKNIIRVTED